MIAPPTPTSVLDAYLALPWTWRAGWDEESECWRVTIGELPDYTAVGLTEADAWAESREALRSLLDAYFRLRKVVPTPAVRVRRIETGRGGAPGVLTYGSGVLAYA